jgi:hypothetical protein
MMHRDMRMNGGSDFVRKATQAVVSIENNRSRRDANCPRKFLSYNGKYSAIYMETFIKMEASSH